MVVVDDGGASLADHPSELPGQPGSQHGIVGMRERVAAFGGTLEAERLSGEGFRISAVIPLEGTP